MIRCIGSDTFYEKLLDLLRALIAHDNAWIIRYTSHSRQDVVHTVNVPAHIKEFYLSRYHHVDPFALHWHNHRQAGVAVLGQVLGPASAIYGEGYAARARVTDELGVFLPSAGHACIVLFLVLADGTFTEEDQQDAWRVLPVLEALHKAHMARLFAGSKAPAGRRPVSEPVLILDRVGVPVFASLAWRQAAAVMPLLNDYAAFPRQPGAISLDDNTHIQIACFGRDFSLAPGGLGVTLLSAPAEEIRAANLPSFPLPEIARLTGRERDLLTLILQRRSTGEIAQHLGIGKGTVKNYRIRLYRKANVTSERALVALFSPLLDEPERVVRDVAAASRVRQTQKKPE